MDSTTVCHVVAMPYPGRGHINPMMNLCKLLALKSDNILVTFVVTEEWLGFIGSDPKPDNIRFGSIPNVLPSELVRGVDMDGFIEAAVTKLEVPFVRILDRLEPPATLIIADLILFWAVSIGNQRNIPVVTLWPMSAAMFSFRQKLDLLSDKVNERKSSTTEPPFDGSSQIKNGFQLISEAFSWVPKAQYLLVSSIYELEPLVIDALKAQFSFPLYTIGPAIPYFKLGHNPISSPTTPNELSYLHWLDCQPSNSVLYVSLGSFLSVSSAQMDEIAAGLCGSGVRFLWVARGETSRLKEGCGAMGLVVPWCDQLRVLSHSCIGGFWTHCGWNSVQEGVFAGVPFLTFPIAADQDINSKLIVEDWRVGWRVKKDFSVENLVIKRQEIAGLVQKFMNLESNEGKEMRNRAKELKQIFRCAIAKDGSSETNINSFIRDISQCCRH